MGKCSSHKPYVLGWNGLILCCFAFAPKHMENVARAQSFFFCPTHSDLQRFLTKRLPTENTTYIYACNQNQATFVFVFFFFFFFCFRGRRRRKGRGD